MFMMGFAIVSGLSGALQLVVPSYAFRLVRRFGAERVGWFLVTAFSFLAVLHLLNLWEPFRSAGVTTLDFIVAASSVLILIGMGHMETLCSQRDQAVQDQESFRADWEVEGQEEISQLTETNQELLRQVACHEQREKALIESEGKFRLLFSENPMPLWIVDVGSGRLLAANHAALRQYGYSEEEFTALSVREIFPAKLLTHFLQHLAKPCPEATACGIWQNQTKDGKEFHAEITAMDLRNPAHPVKLIVAANVSQRWQQELKFRDALKLEVTG